MHAVLRVDRDARDAYDRYATQADDLGVPVRSSDGRDVCSRDRRVSLRLSCSSVVSAAEGDERRGYLLVRATAGPDGQRAAGGSLPPSCGTGGYIAVLHLSGDPEAVVGGYAAEFEQQQFQGQVPGHDEVLVGHYEAAGSGFLDATAVLGSETYLLVERCNG